jgi:molybdopterin/thiamine biosynthesis adenylyltransferase
MLSADELERYARHIVLRDVGGPGQQALKEASVLVIGAGGLGAPALMYLAAAGIGELGVVDDDTRRFTRSIRMSALPRMRRGSKLRMRWS